MNSTYQVKWKLAQTHPDAVCHVCRCKVTEGEPAEIWVIDNNKLYCPPCWRAEGKSIFTSTID